MSPSPAAWALHSPRRFTLVLLGGITVLIVITTLGLRSGDPAHETAQTQAAHAADTAVASPSPDISPDHADHEKESIGPAGRRVVQRFLRHYLAPTSRVELKKLRALCTPELWNGLKVADPSNMPRGPVRKIDKDTDGAFTATFLVTLHHSSLTVDVVAAPGGLRVSTVEPVTP